MLRIGRLLIQWWGNSWDGTFAGLDWCYWRVTLGRDNLSYGWVSIYAGPVGFYVGMRRRR